MGGRTRGTWTKERSPQKLGVWRPKRTGCRDRIPKAFRKSIKAIYRKLVDLQPELFENAIVRDLKHGKGMAPFQHVQLAAHYLDGKPVETVKMEGTPMGPTSIEFVLARPNPAELSEPQKELPAVTVEHVEAHPDQS